MPTVTVAVISGGGTVRVEVTDRAGPGTPELRPASRDAGFSSSRASRRGGDFRGFADAGRKLSDLHLNYETASPYGGIVEDVRGATSATSAAELYRVAEMKIPKVKGQPDWSTIIYNTRVTLSNIPEEAYRYQLGARSEVEWIIDRYQVKTDTSSGIVNDPNDWSDNPRYIIDLLKRIVTVSLETMKIIVALPALDIIE